MTMIRTAAAADATQVEQVAQAIVALVAITLAACVIARTLRMFAAISAPRSILVERRRQLARSLVLLLAFTALMLLGHLVLVPNGPAPAIGVR
jgi:hypothetical protein